MKINSRDFQVRPGAKVKLKQWPTRVKPFFKSKKRYQKLLEKHVEALSALQHLHHASNRQALLLIFQGMDAAGKDGAIRHVMSGVNPQGCEVFSFKQPSAEELEHDFLWRTTRHLPERGRIGIFNRSYYEEVLVVRVHPEILRSQGLPEELRDERTLWNGRYRSITDLESHLHRNGTRVVKFFLHLSKGEQRDRFLARIDDPEKNWKFSLADIHERKYWRHYMQAYEACLTATSTAHAPWYVVPADDKANARWKFLIVPSTAAEWVPAARPNTTLLLLLVPAAAEVALSTWWWAAYVAVGLTTMDGRRRIPSWPFFVSCGIVAIALIVDVAVERSLSPGDLVIRVPYEVLVAFTGCGWAYACGAFGARMLIRDQS